MLVFETYPWLVDIFVILLGLILGSFATALAYRMPRQRDWLLEEIGEIKKNYNNDFWTGLITRSRCPSCETVLGALDLIPLLSWVLRGGKCSTCSAKISIRYPLIEIFSALFFWLIYHQLGLSTTGILLMAAFPFMLSSSVIDLEFLILPDEFSLLMAFLGLLHAIYLSLFAGFVVDPLMVFGSSVLCAVTYGLVGWGLQAGFYKLSGKEGLGWGDIKLFAIGGLWLGWDLMPVYLLLSSVFGLVIGGVWRLFNKQALFPFGPALILALYLILMYSEFFTQLL